MVPGIENANFGWMAEVVDLSKPNAPHMFKKVKSVGRKLFYLENDYRFYNIETGEGRGHGFYGKGPKYKVVRILKPVISDDKKKRKN